ncbi:MAG: DUF2490 domain-containing protein [Reyranella sp.]|nr:MAG: DUF2490 domain-containing protein [Reyranella sp.]
MRRSGGTSLSSPAKGARTTRVAARVSERHSAAAASETCVFCLAMATSRPGSAASSTACCSALRSPGTSTRPRQGVNSKVRISSMTATREDFRWLDSGFAVRLRERLQVQRDVTIGNYTFTPYTSAEVFFDTRYGQFARYRLTLGTTFPIDKHISVEPYLIRQVDWVPSGVITNALGFILIMALEIELDE